MILLGAWTTPSGFFTMGCIFALFSASLGPILTECAYMICGSDLFTFAYGYIQVANGLGNIIGPPAAGRNIALSLREYDIIMLWATSWGVLFLPQTCILQTENVFYGPLKNILLRQKQNTPMCFMRF